MNIIDISDICKTYNQNTAPIYAVDHVSLSIKQESVNALTGKSGSGKSTLLRIIGLQERPDSGTIRLNDQIISDSDEVRSAFRLHHIGFVWQDYKLIREYTIKDNIIIPCYLADKKCDELLFNNLVNLLDISDILDKRPSRCSGGQQQRAAIARAFILRPEIVLADEPTGNLDSVNTEMVFHLFKDVAKNLGTTILFGTHDNALAKKADVTITLKDGKLKMQ